MYTDITALTPNIGATGNVIARYKGGWTGISANAISQPLSISPILGLDTTPLSSNLPSVLSNGTVSGVTLIKIGQILTLNGYDMALEPSTPFGFTLGNGTFEVFLTGFYTAGFGSAGSDSQYMIFQGNNVNPIRDTPAAPLTSIPGYIQISTQWRNTNPRQISGWAKKISNDTSGGVDGTGNYGRAIQP